MLYISRRVCNGMITRGLIRCSNYGVVDSVTGEERILLLPEVKTEIEDGKDIHGVVIDYDIVDKESSLVALAPFQEQRMMSKNQVRALLLYGIQVIVYNGMIADILWSNHTLKSDAVLRLSNFGTVCTDLLINAGVIGTAVHTVTLVLDDKLKHISDSAFWIADGFGKLGVGADKHTGIIFDLRELTDNSVVKRVYEQLNRFTGPIAQWVIDRPERKILYCDR